MFFCLVLNIAWALLWTAGAANLARISRRIVEQLTWYGFELETKENCAIRSSRGRAKKNGSWIPGAGTLLVSRVRSTWARVAWLAAICACNWHAWDRIICYSACKTFVTAFPHCLTVLFLRQTTGTVGFIGFALTVGCDRLRVHASFLVWPFGEQDALRVLRQTNPEQMRDIRFISEQV